MYLVALVAAVIALLYYKPWTMLPVPPGPSALEVPPFEVVQLPGRGMGMIATRKIKVCFATLYHQYLTLRADRRAHHPGEAALRGTDEGCAAR